MKKLILFLLITVSIRSFAQDGKLITRDQWYGYIESRIDTIITKIDTTKVLMLACDTTTFYAYIVDDKSGQGTCPYKNNESFWIEGYEVYNFRNGNIKYLYSNKQPISKKIVVWMTKTLP